MLHNLYGLQSNDTESDVADPGARWHRFHLKLPMESSNEVIKILYELRTHLCNSDIGNHDDGVDQGPLLLSLINLNASMDN